MATTVDETIRNVRNHELSIERVKNQIATVNEQIKEELESMDEYDDVLNLEGQLAVAKEKLRTALQSKSGYIDLLEKKGELQETLKGHKHILSEELVTYYGQTKERQIEIGANGDARAVVLTGKLGKEQKYQTSLLNPITDLEDAAKKYEQTTVDTENEVPQSI